jgi:transcriptional regulator with XRE-family HTH domain
MTSWFDAPTFATYLRAKRGERNLREVFTEIGTASPSTLSRIERGAVPDLETFFRLCSWLQLPTGAFIRSVVSTHEQQGIEEDSAQLVEQALSLAQDSFKPASRRISLSTATQLV